MEAGRQADRGTAQAPRAWHRRQAWALISLSPLWEASLRGGDNPPCFLPFRAEQRGTYHRGGPPGSVSGSYSIHADLWMSGESKGWLIASELHSQKAAGSLSPEALSGSKKASSKLETQLDTGLTHRHTFINAYQRSWGKLVNEERWQVTEEMVCTCVYRHVSLDMSVSVPVSLEGTSMTHRSYFDQSSLWEEPRKLGQSVSALRGVLCRPQRTGVG